MTRYVVHRDGAGELEGLWIGDVRQADDALIGEVLARHGVRGDVTTSRYRVIRNTFNDRGGVFVRFVGDETTAEAGALPRRELVVGDQHCLVHEEFDTFSRDAAAGHVALLKTTIDAASASDLFPLYEAAVGGRRRSGTAGPGRHARPAPVRDVPAYLPGQPDLSAGHEA
ncbi:hypothetical protein [Streptomyces sp. DG1A-41]|uniref:hypothetical protein n=1 Tax=Streptomyces sp. DG1A-41 TaxID=3125779 RepID=UPI0030CACE3C